MSPRALACLLAVLLFSGALAAGQAPSFETAEEGGEESEVLVVSGPEQVEAELRRRVEELFEELPEDYKLRVTVSRIFNSHPDHPKMVACPVSTVPLNPHGEEDGLEIQRFYRFWPQRVKRTIPWRDGERHGVEKEYGEAGGDPDRRYLKATTPWVEGQIHGVKKLYHPNGEVRSITTYRRGEQHGPSKVYDEEGRLLRAVSLRRGERHGKLVEYWPETGKPRREIPYRKGEVHGTMREFYADGSLKREVRFVRNAMHGTEKQYDPDGSILRVRVWEDGAVVSEKTPDGK
jgi:antitoxin component YwqK of YwqJK toxin-antitoxin module